MTRTVKPHNSGQLCQQEFFHYFEGSFSINGHFGHLDFSTIEGFSTILKSAIEGLYCTVCLGRPNKTLRIFTIKISIKLLTKKSSHIAKLFLICPLFCQRFYWDFKDFVKKNHCMLTKMRLWWYVCTPICTYLLLTTNM